MLVPPSFSHIFTNKTTSSIWTFGNVLYITQRSLQYHTRLYTTSTEANFTPYRGSTMCTINTSPESISSIVQTRPSKSLSAVSSSRAFCSRPNETHFILISLILFLCYTSFSLHFPRKPCLLSVSIPCVLFDSSSRSVHGTGISYLRLPSIYYHFT